MIGPKLPESELLETLIHEGLHASDWDKTEEAVDTIACDIASFLRRIGFHLTT